MMINDNDLKSIRQKKTGVLGGSFDPVHLGHVALAESALKEAGLDRVIVMPARIQPFKQEKRVTEDYHREAMVRLAFEGNDKVEVSQYELNNTGISYTIKTLTYLRDTYPKEKLFFILGTDSFLSMEEWHRGSEILKSFSVMVSSRPGYREAELESKIEEYKEKYGTDMVKLISKMPSVSSTEVRERIAAGKDVSEMIPYPVERYIKKNGLYKQDKRIY